MVEEKNVELEIIVGDEPDPSETGVELEIISGPEENETEYWRNQCKFPVDSHFLFW